MCPSKCPSDHLSGTPKDYPLSCDRDGRKQHFYSQFAVGQSKVGFHWGQFSGLSDGPRNSTFNLLDRPNAKIGIRKKVIYTADYKRMLNVVM
jgi:hypothetical protein